MTCNFKPEQITRQSAIDLLEIAVVYLQDGAPNTALERAQEAVAQLEELAARRNRMLAEIMAEGGAP